MEREDFIFENSSITLLPKVPERKSQKENPQPVKNWNGVRMRVSISDGIPGVGSILI